jgi:hypothetical protein
LTLLDGGLKQILRKNIPYEIHYGVLRGGCALGSALAHALLRVLVSRLDGNDQNDTYFFLVVGFQSLSC